MVSLTDKVLNKLYPCALYKTSIIVLRSCCMEIQTQLTNGDSSNKENSFEFKL